MSGFGPKVSVSTVYIPHFDAVKLPSHLQELLLNWLTEVLRQTSCSLVILRLLRPNCDSSWNEAFQVWNDGEADRRLRTNWVFQPWFVLSLCVYRSDKLITTLSPPSPLLCLPSLLQDIDWVQTEKHVFEQASTNPFLVGLHSCFQTESR